MGSCDKKRIAIVVMAYKASLSPTEAVSFLQCCRILGNYKFVLVAPNSVKLDVYMHLISDNIEVEIKRFSDSFFLSTKTYNTLMLSEMFYQAFSEYEYILIYQLDAFVFQDILLDFVVLGYDYIGAPWLDGISCRVGEFFCQKGVSEDSPTLDADDSQFVRVYVGNGGLSLRRIPAFLRLLMLNSESAAAWNSNEDIYYALQGVYHESFRVADVAAALRFSFELNPARCYELSGFKLPFGCHAWERYDKAFWKVHMREFGWEI